ncbi:MAG: CRISPR system precrRNA processing endoribonuclease RAMP protein Cas6 [Dethiobacter sp.]
MPPAPEFHIFFRQAMRRISAMAYFHHGQPLEADYVGLTERSRQVALVANKTHWQDWERYSRRQDQRIKMGGLIGEATYQGNLDEFLPWLALDRHIHIGKNTVFGLGKYSMTVL